jgi:sec-independent protein translocase protein TatB
MFNVGSGELLAILALALIILGPGRLPDAVRTAGRVTGELRRLSAGFQQELRNALEDREVDEELDTASSDQDAETARTPRSTTRQAATGRPNPTGPTSG